MDFSILGLHLLTGLAYGMLLFMMASGMSIIYGLMNVVNLTHGTFFALGAYFIFTFVSQHFSFWFSLILSIIIVSVFALLVERVFLSRLYGKHIEEVLLTFGIFFILMDVMRFLWGADPLTVKVPEQFDFSIPLGPVMFPIYRLFVIIIGLILAGVLWYIERRTQIGAIIRAGVDDRVMLGALGINVKLVFTFVFIFGAALAALGGALAAPILGVYLGMDMEVLILSLVIVVIGGLGTWKGTFVGAILVGMIETLGQVWFPSISMALIFILMIIVLLVRPTGLFGKEVGT